MKILVLVVAVGLWLFFCSVFFFVASNSIGQADVIGNLGGAAFAGVPLLIAIPMWWVPILQRVNQFQVKTTTSIVVGTLALMPLGAWPGGFFSGSIQGVLQLQPGSASRLVDAAIDRSSWPFYALYALVGAVLAVWLSAQLRSAEKASQ